MDLNLTLRITDPPPDWLDRFTALIAALGPAAVTDDAPDPGWTADRALTFIEHINPRGRQLLRAAVDGGGRVSGEEFRAVHGDDALSGRMTSLTGTLKSGTAKGWWPTGTVAPLTPTGPDKRGWSKTAFYYLGDGLLGAFRTAFARHDAAE
ncbi:hypothetical protein G3I60_05125 [Streptomyces sp. SID13666]|uniref:hypothetical protein n=1 Tax=Streptomyces sp. SID13666 TaxID=2706054 RepID=UPI0013C28483|nr:hypothetical protein [Streptomyces sp. SID13666]NEA53552.1 hypothetical protein [Streptomyces sp. SID13666]